MRSEIAFSFLASYFHQDWDLDADDARGVVALFLSCQPKQTEVLAIANALKAIADEHEGEEEEEWLFRDFGCDYRPSVDGLTVSQWLRRLVALLQNGDDSVH